MPAFIVTQNTDVATHYHVAIADDSDQAIKLVDELYGVSGSAYSAREVQEPATYVASSYSRRKEQS